MRIKPFEIKKNILRPAFWTIITICIVTIGILASLFNKEILAFARCFLQKLFKDNANCIILWVHEHIGLFFWFLLVLTITMFYVREFFVRKDDEYQRNELKSIIRTHPPESFLSYFSNVFPEIFNLLEIDINTQEICEKTIRNLIYILLGLIIKFEDNLDKSRISANIMIFIPSSDENIHSYQANVIFCEPSIDLARTDGVLVVEKSLSTFIDRNNQSDTENPPIDDELQLFSLPIPQIKKWNNLHKVLPGAPYSFCTKESYLFDDVSKVAKWCQDEGDFTEDITNQINDYFLKIDIKSFLSIPIFYKSDDPIGILNIHSNTISLLRSSPKAALNFGNITKPIQVLIGKTLMQYLAYKNRN